MKKYFFGLSLALALSAPSSALASNSASATTSSDIKGEKLDIEFAPGAVDTPSKVISVGGAHISTPSGNNGVSGNVEVRKKWLVNTDTKDRESGDGYITGTLLVDPALKGRVDVMKNPAGTGRDASRIDVQAGEIGLFYGQLWTAHDDKQTAEKRSALMNKIRENTTTLSNLESDNYALNDRCREFGSYCKAYLDAKHPGMTVEQAKQTVLKQLEAAKALNQEILAEIKAAGFTQKESDQNYVDRKNNEVSSTADIGLVKVNGIYQDFKDIGIKQYGAQFKFLETSFHVAGRVNGVNLDLCAQVIPLAAVAGQVEGREKVIMSMAKACAGIGLGPVGHLQGSISGATDYHGYAKAAVDVELKKIGGTPISVGYTHEYETTRDGIDIRRNLIGGKVVF